jgi:hypothetical protein
MLHRRDAMLRLGQIGLGALTLPGLLRAQTVRAAEAVDRSRETPPRGSAKSCILVYLWGGPPQQDLWDMKPEAPEGIRSLFQPIPTVVPGIDVCDQMPLFAQHTDKLAIVRSLTHPSLAHEPSVYYTLTGHQNASLVSPRNMRNRRDFPNVGSIVSALAPGGDLPAAVTIPRPIGHDGVTYSGTYAGFLGSRHDPMELAEAPNSNDKPAHAVTLPPDMGEVRLLARRGLLNVLEEQDRLLQQAREARGLDSYRERAFAMLASPGAKKAFNIELEDPRMRDRYGRNEYGESFLLARRLVEAGVRLVTITWLYFMPNGRVANVWDNHGGTGGLGGITGYAMLKEKYCIPPLDQAFSALIEDLSLRGELDETLVAMFGEFGRTPKINATVGRDHWGPCQSAVLAGGGVRGGQIFGSSDRDAAYPKTNPVSPEDMLATIYHAFGLAPETEIHDRESRPHRISQGTPITALF